MENDTDIAFLAASLEREMRQSLAGSSGLKYNRTDFRNFLPQGAQQDIRPQHIQQNYPQQSYPPQNYPPQYVQQSYPPQDYVVPEGVIPPSPASFLPMPKGYSGEQMTQAGNAPFSIENTDSFNIPNYSQNKQYLEDEQEFRDALIKEIKSQKSTISKLSREIKALTTIVTQLKDSLSPQICKEEISTETPALQQYDTTIQS